jgi:hypothetical protein
MTAAIELVQADLDMAAAESLRRRRFIRRALLALFFLGATRAASAQISAAALGASAVREVNAEQLPGPEPLKLGRVVHASGPVVLGNERVRVHAQLPPPFNLSKGPGAGRYEAAVELRRAVVAASPGAPYAYRIWGEIDGRQRRLLGRLDREVLATLSADAGGSGDVSSLRLAWPYDGGCRQLTVELEPVIEPGHAFPDQVGQVELILSVRLLR